MKIIASIILVYLCLLNSSHCLKILGLFPHIGRSHYDVFLPLLKALSAKGHEVTSISYFPQKDKIPRFRDMSLQKSEASARSGINVLDFKAERKRTTRYLEPIVILMGYYAPQACVNFYENKNVQSLLNSNETFDLVFMEMFNTDCYLGLASKFNAPIIGFSSCYSAPWILEHFGSTNNPSYVANSALDYTDVMTFWERLENSLVHTLHVVYFKTVMKSYDNSIIKRYLGEDAPTIDEISKNISLLLVNNHFTLNNAVPRSLNVIDVGGIHIGEVKPLPKNIERFINESANGIIYFSLGSMIKGHTFPEEKRQAFLNAFSKLPQRVLWKWENETMPGKPENVMIQNWLPQFDILCHPNVKAFISHGGLLGTTEATHCGVPMVLMPQYGDQYVNAAAMKQNKAGVILDIYSATEEQIFESIQKVLSSDYQKQAKDLSERFRDRPLPPMETAIYWTEYVAKYRGAPYMRTAATDMPLYQYLLLDVIAFVSVVLIVFVGVSWKIVRLVLSRVFCNKKQKLKLN